MNQSSSTSPRSPSASSYPSLVLRSPPREVVVEPSTWRSHPLRKLGAMVFVILVAMGIRVISPYPWTGPVAFGALVLALWPVWLPVRYRLSRQGIDQYLLGWRRRHVDWRHVVGWSWHREGVYIRARSSRRWSPGLFAVFIPWHGARDEILEVLEYYLLASCGRDGSSRSQVTTSDRGNQRPDTGSSVSTGQASQPSGN